ncbi:MAG: ArnT family glycosyltransferase [Candidatus Fervidibacter sp.]|uniref:ArnT family glycosyltransferase n=1 Tax=Candidatus Fervidibacter sp. TaxID=3100871 RepID=UPI00404B2BB9
MSWKTLILWFLLTLAILLCFWGSHKTPLFDTDEPRYAQAAREMMQRNDWVLPTFNGQPRYAKPAMFYWLLILAYKVFGVNEFAARFWSGVAGAAIAFTLLFAIRPTFGLDAALTASLCWLTSLGALVFSHAAVTDMVLTAFMTGTIVSFWTGVQKGKPSWFFLASVLAGAAVLTKGPVGLALPSLILTVAVPFARPSFPFNLSRLIVLGLGCFLTFLVVVLPWYAAVSVKTNGEFLRQFLFVENVKRYAQSGNLPLWLHLAYFPVTLICLGSPWSAFGVWMLGSTPYLTKEQKQWVAVLKVWALLPVLVFTFSRTKNPQYVLLSIPALTSLAALLVSTSTEIETALGEKLWSTKLQRATLTWFVLWFFLAIILFSVEPLINAVPDWRTRLSGDEFVRFGWVTFALGAIALTASVLGLLMQGTKTSLVLGKSFLSFFLPSVVATLSFNAILLTVFVPRLGYYRQEPLKHFAQMASSQLGGNDLLVVYHRDLSSAVFYSNRRVMRVDSLRHLSSIVRQNRRVDVFAHVKDLKELRQLSRFHLVEKQRAFLWLSNKTVSCPIHQ